MPRFILDENVPLSLRDTLIRKGFQARLAVEALGPGAKNHDIADLAKQSHDVILTFDEDFLRLRSELRTLVKVIYIDIHPRDPREAERLLDRWIDKCLSILDEATVVGLTKTGPVLKED